MSTELKTYLAKHYSKKTAIAYEREILIYLENHPKAQYYNYTELTNYIGTLRKRYINPSTVNRIVCSIKAYYSYLCDAGHRKDNPTKSIFLKDKISRDIQLQDLFTTEELEQLLNAKPERYINLDYRNKVLISLLIYQALKPKEIEHLQVDELNLEQATIYIKASPKTNSRTLYLKANQILLFKKYIEEIRIKLLKENKGIKNLILDLRGTAMAAEDITKHIKRNYKLFLPRNINAQSIRQSVISNLLKENKNLRLVQVFAGHKYPSTTERYKQSNVMQLQLALEFYHPIK